MNNPSINDDIYTVDYEGEYSESLLDDLSDMDAMLINGSQNYISAEDNNLDVKNLDFALVGLAIYKIAWLVDLYINSRRRGF